MKVKMTIHNRIDQIQRDAKSHAESDLKYFKEFTESIKEIRKELKEFRTEMSPVKEAFDGVKWSGWAIAKIVSFISLIVGIGYGIKQIFNVKLGK